MSFCLYRHYDKEYCLLYVGQTMSPKQRKGSHSRDKSWWREVMLTTYQWFEDRAQVLAAEREAIENEIPLFNNRFNQSRQLAFPFGSEVAVVRDIRSFSAPKSRRVKTANGGGSVTYNVTTRRWMGRYSVPDPETGKSLRKTLYGASEQEAWAKLIDARAKL